jgi:hypothetical protein
VKTTLVKTTPVKTTPVKTTLVKTTLAGKPPVPPESSAFSCPIR